MRRAGNAYWWCKCKKWVTPENEGQHKSKKCITVPPPPTPFKPPLAGDKYKLYFNGFWYLTTVDKATTLGVSVKWDGYPGLVQHFAVAEWARRSCPAAAALSPEASSKRKRD